jgi:hypothetical protein
MLSLIEVTCPHCGARGQIMLPPVGTIIVGPCPECQGLVVVFCGHVLALDKEVMLNGTPEAKRDHMLLVLTGFLKERLGQMIDEEIQGSQEPETSSEEPEHLEPTLAGSVQPERIGHSRTHGHKRPPISDTEFKTFSNVELKLIDNQDYFKAIFG